jgi:hypothetical protein
MAAPTFVSRGRAVRDLVDVAWWQANFPTPYGGRLVELPMKTDEATADEALAYAVANAETLCPSERLRLTRVNGKLVAL